MTRSERQLKKRLALKAAGVCVDCRKQQAGEGHTLCPTCRFKRILAYRKRELKLASKGWVRWAA